MLRLGKISAHWPWEDVRPAIVGPDGKEMKMKRVLTAEEIAGIAFRKQNVNQPLEQEKTGENAPATSGNKRKAAEASQSQQKKKKLTPKQREDKRNDNFVPIEPRSADLPPPSAGHAEETHHTPPRVNPDVEATAESKDKTIHLDSECLNGHTKDEEGEVEFIDGENRCWECC
ncbi:uncharacterized protein [Rutidosis leptorrhynchoides]|uniref:uncharacterized protein n=1 Tax=Rutidosis leptorrhynchoides TaxID=125765 RepID=UPI003A997B86